VSSNDPTIKDFEAAIAELEGIVKKLEEGDLALEKSLELYERGVAELASDEFIADFARLFDMEGASQYLFEDEESDLSGD